jgi:hypothetical protein
MIHNEKAIKRIIKFYENIDSHKDVHTSEKCCWNCFWAMMTYEFLWCEREMGEVDFRDLCNAWEGETIRINIEH